MDRLHHLILEVLLRREHCAPGGFPSGTVGKRADHLVSQAIVVADALLLPKHGRSWAAAKQTLLGIRQPTQARDPSVLGARLALPASVLISLDGGHANAQVFHGGRRHGYHHRQQRILVGKAGSVNASFLGGQGLDQLLHRWWRSDDVRQGLPPGEETDVFEIDDEQGCAISLGEEGQKIVIGAEASIGQRITPHRKDVGLKAIWNSEPIVQSDSGEHLTLLIPIHAIRRQGQGHTNPGDGPRKTVGFSPGEKWRRQHSGSAQSEELQ